MASVFGSDNSETITWWSGVTNGNDLIYGFGGNDTIYGLGGDDTLKGGGGADYINGGSGNDTASYLDSATGVTVSLETGLGYGGTAEGDRLTGIENLLGSAHNDVLSGDAGANTLAGAAGDDILKGGGGADKLYGDDGNDTLKGGGGADQLNGGAGIDTASYTASDAGVFVSLITNTAAYGDAEGDHFSSVENVTGSAYHDDLWGDNGANVLRGMGGNDTLLGYGGNDALVGDEGNDSLYGMDGNDTLRGDSGDDMLNGGAGNDTMIGGVGNDTYFVDNAADVITELAGQGNDTVFSSALGYTLSANVETLSLDTPGATAVYGTGNAQANVIYGNAGNNVLEGGGGADVLNGLGGNDNFVFRPGDANGDVIHGFDGNGAGVGDFMYFIGYGTAAQGANMHQIDATHWQINSANGLVHDTITLDAGTTIGAGDYVFI